jgi:hypothetical protein
MTSTGKRTNQENKALHVWCDELSREMLNTGTSMRLLIERTDITATPDTIKWYMQQIILNKYGFDKTSKLTSKQLHEVSEDIIKAFGMVGIFVPFPSQENTESYMNSFVQ